MGCCFASAMNRQMDAMNRQMAAQMGGQPTRGGAGGASAAARRNPQLARFGPGAGLAAAIMTQVGNSIEQAQQRALEAAKQQYARGPVVQSDGTLRLKYITVLWAFSPAYPQWLSSVIPQAEYAAVLEPVNKILAISKNANGNDDATADVADNLRAGNLAALQNPSNIIASAQKSSALLANALQQIQGWLFQVNRDNQLAGKQVQWQFKENVYYTTSTVPNAGGHGTHTTRNKNVEYFIDIIIPGGAAALPAGAFAASHSGVMAGGAAPMMAPGPAGGGAGYPTPTPGMGGAPVPSQLPAPVRSTAGGAPPPRPARRTAPPPPGPGGVVMNPAFNL